MDRFPLGPAQSEVNRGVSEDVLRDSGYELPGDYQDKKMDEAENQKNAYWPSDEKRRLGKAALDGIKDTLRNSTPPQPRPIPERPIVDLR